MLTISTATLEAVDVIDAGVHAGLKSGGNIAAFAGQFVLKVNFVGLGRFVIAGSTDFLMGVKKNRMEPALTHAEVGYSALQMKRTTSEIDDAALMRRKIFMASQTENTIIHSEADTMQHSLYDFNPDLFSHEDASV